MRFAHSAQFAVSLVGHVIADPEPRVVGDVEVSAFSLTVPREPGGSRRRHLSRPCRHRRLPRPRRGREAGRGLCVRVSGTLDVGQCPTPGDRQWGLQLVADEISVEEIDVGDA